MKMKQAWGWLMAGVVAAGLNANYHDGGLQWAHRAVDQVGYNVGAVLALASGRAGQFVAQAQLATLRTPMAASVQPCRFAPALARVQERVQERVAEKMAEEQMRLDHFQAMSDREQAALARVEANRARIEAKLAAVQIPAEALNPVVFKNMDFREFSNFKVTVPPACSRVRVSIPRMPKVKMPAMPPIHVEAIGAGPV